MKSIEVIYSPLCEASIAFVGEINEWLNNTGVLVRSTPFDEMSRSQKELYVKNGILIAGRMSESCFTDIFFEEKLIDSVPLKKTKILSALNLASTGSPCDRPVEAGENLSLQQVRAAIYDNSIQWIPITKETAQDEMTMCLRNYPHGNPPVRFHKECIEAKNNVFNKV